MIVIALLILVFGFASGYAVGWNRAAHPGKVEAQAESVIAEVESKVK